MLKKLTYLSLFAALGAGIFIVTANAQPQQKKEGKDITLSAVKDRQTAGQVGVPQPEAYWIGVGIVPVPDVLLQHFAAKEGKTGNDDSNTEQAGLAVIDQVVPDGPAAKGGLKRGDVILQFGGKKIHSLADLVEQVAAAKDKEQNVTVIRDGKKTDVKVTPALRPGEQTAFSRRGMTPFGFRQMPPLTSQQGMKLGKDIWVGPRDPQKMMREMEEYFRQMQGGTDDEPMLILPEDSDVDGVRFERHLAVSSVTENGKTKITVKQRVPNGSKTEEKIWEAEKIEDLPEDIRREVQGFLQP
ncbi:MAG: PDZ domain-containing protein [Planctomycetaceae bacterium]|jgi:membrane-associated protease RseP (regulator of RpoE activity)|nr:PDZ domain-containing protein [Planctomycetaceae bacterium]